MSKQERENVLILEKLNPLLFQFIRSYNAVCLFVCLLGSTSLIQRVSNVICRQIILLLLLVVKF